MGTQMSFYFCTEGSIKIAGNAEQLSEAKVIHVPPVSFLFLLLNKDN
jgi:hypothetical protein